MFLIGEKELGTVVPEDIKVNKGVRWMPRYQEAKKDVLGCEKHRGAAKRALIRWCPNGVTRFYDHLKKNPYF